MDLVPTYLRLLLALIAVFPLVLTTPSQAQCISLTAGPVVLDTVGCAQMEPEKHFDSPKENLSWVKNLDAAGKKSFYNSYRGVYLSGKILKSNAIQSGLSNQPGALSGETINLFIPPGGSLTCASIANKRLTGNLKEVCCSGSGDAPCLLGTSYLLLDAKAIGDAKSDVGDASRQKVKLSKEYLAGDAAFKKRDWKAAVVAYEKVRRDSGLDVKGFYKLGYAYRELDQCRGAIAPLKQVYEMHNQKQVWADEEKIARRAIFLLARCHSKLNDPSQTMIILNGYLLEPEKYADEIRDSLKHKDFGWIHTSKEYRTYMKDAKSKIKPN